MTSAEPTPPVAVPAKQSSQPWLVFVAALVAAVAAWGLIHGVHPAFKVSAKYDVPNLGAPAEMFQAHKSAQNFVNACNAALYLAILGGLVAAAMAACQPGAQSLPMRVAIAVAIAAVGGVLGGLAGGVLHPLWVQPAGIPGLQHAVGVQAALLAPLGLGVGLAFGMAGPAPRSATTSALAGLVAGGLAGLLYPVAASVLLPAADTAPLLPQEWSSRLLWALTFAVLAGALIPTAGNRRQEKHTPPPPDAQESTVQ